jgi:hypothetical protein
VLWTPHVWPGGAARSQDRNELRPSNPASPRQAPSSASWERVVGVMHRPEHPVAVRVELGTVGLHQLPEGGGPVAAACRLQQRRAGVTHSGFAGAQRRLCEWLLRE